MGVVAEARLQRLVERHGLASNDVLEGATLPTGEHRLVDGCRMLGLGEDAATARAAQGLVRGEGDHIGVRHRVGVRTTGDEAGDVRRVEHQHRSRFVGDGLERFGVEPARVARGAGHDELGPMLQRKVTHLLHIDSFVARRHFVGHEVVELAAGVHRRTVGEVPTVIEAEAEHRVAGLEQCLVDTHVGVGAAVRLHVGMVGTEQCLHALDGQRLDLVDDGIAAVVALARVALGVFVGEGTAHGTHDGR